MRTSADACRVLSLDGGGAKGFYTLGVLKEIEAMVGQPICECFDLIFGTSTGGIIAGLFGYQVRQITAIPEMLTIPIPEILMKRLSPIGGGASSVPLHPAGADAFPAYSTGTRDRGATILPQ